MPPSSSAYIEAGFPSSPTLRRTTPRYARPDAAAHPQTPAAATAYDHRTNNASPKRTTTEQHRRAPQLHRPTHAAPTPLMPSGIGPLCGLARIGISVCRLLSIAVSLRLPYIYNLACSTKPPRPLHAAPTPLMPSGPGPLNGLAHIGKNACRPIAVSRHIGSNVCRLLSTAVRCASHAPTHSRPIQRQNMLSGTTYTCRNRCDPTSTQPTRKTTCLKTA